eukprot:INCI15811.3.p1 GENE.INCI15811.3~~INCI15811.3.p1  ORF type:complete len:335 (+),score=69.37 INCI15811.3:88-1092(+)
MSNLHGNTALHLAALFGNADAVGQLLRNGHSACVQNDFGKLPEELAKTTDLRLKLTQLRKNEVQRLIQTLASTRAERDSLCAEAAHLAEVVSKQTNRQTQLLRALERLEPIRNIDFRSNKPIPKPAAPAAAAASAAVETDSSKPTKEEESARSKAAAKTQKGKPKGPKPKKEKKGKGAAKPAGSNNANSSASLPIAEIDIRVGEIIKVWEHPDSEKLWCESINCGEAEPRQILSGLRANFTAEQMKRKVLVVCNLKPAKLGGIASQGMVLCASSDDHAQVEFLTPPDGAAIGERVEFEGIPNAAAAGSSRVAKKKTFPQGGSGFDDYSGMHRRV